VDYSRLRLFVSQNNFNREQIEELMAIIQDMQHELIKECAERLSMSNAFKMMKKNES